MRYLLCACLICVGWLGISAPLTMTLAANQPALFCEMVEWEHDGPDVARYLVEPVSLSLTFTNTGDTPIKLWLYEPIMDCFSLRVEGPTAESTVARAMLLELTLTTPSAEDFPTLEPGKSYRFPIKSPFPGTFGYTNYQLTQPGDYRLSLTYHYTPTKGINRLEKQEFSRGCWQGAITSNELTLPMLQPGTASDGLRMALYCKPDTKPGSTIVNTVAYVQNVSEKELTVPAWDLQSLGMLLFDDTGKVLPFTGGAKRSRVPTLEETRAIIPPGAIHAFPMPASQYIPDEKDDTPAGTFNLTDCSGFVRSAQVTGPSTTMQAILSMDYAVVKDAPVNPLWRGRVTSRPITVNWDMTSYRAKLLGAAPEHFEIAMNYLGGQDKPMPTLCITTETPQNADDPFRTTILLKQTEVPALIVALAKTGLLRDIQPLTMVNTLPHPAEQWYELAVLNPTKGIVPFNLALSWNLDTLRKLDALRAALPAEQGKLMEPLLKRISAPRQQWEAAEALRRRVSLSTKGLTLQQTVAALCQATGSEAVKWKSEEWMQNLPVATLDFIDVPAEEALQAVAESTNVNFFFRNGMVIMQN